jgi:hypothetical protein
MKKMSIKIIIDRKSDYEVVIEKKEDNKYEACVFDGDALVIDSSGHKLYCFGFHSIENAVD